MSIFESIMENSVEAQKVCPDCGGYAIEGCDCVIKKRRKIYVASSWRNDIQPEVVYALRSAGHEVYDFKNPHGNTGFSWSEIDENWEQWTQTEYLEALKHPLAERGFVNDWMAMEWADTCVLVMPSGRSAHIEAGYFVGAFKQLIILISDDEPELMYKMANYVEQSIDGVLRAAADIVKSIVQCSCPECKDMTLEVIVSRTGKAFSREFGAEDHWFTGLARCSKCGYKGSYGESTL